MSVKRWATKRDRTEPDILRAITQVGAEYMLLDAFDVLVWFKGHLTMLDCKSPCGRMTRNQQCLIERGWPIRFVETPDEALIAIGASYSHGERRKANESADDVSRDSRRTRRY